MVREQGEEKRTRFSENLTEGNRRWSIQIRGQFYSLENFIKGCSKEKTSISDFKRDLLRVQKQLGERYLFGYIHVKVNVTTRYSLYRNQHVYIMK
jgi:hypothetical protein